MKKSLLQTQSITIIYPLPSRWDIFNKKYGINKHYVLHRYFVQKNCVVQLAYITKYSYTHLAELFSHISNSIQSTVYCIYLLQFNTENHVRYTSSRYFYISTFLCNFKSMREIASSNNNRRKPSRRDAQSKPFFTYLYLQVVQLHTNVVVEATIIVQWAKKPGKMLHKKDQ